MRPVQKLGGVPIFAQVLRREKDATIASNYQEKKNMFKVVFFLTEFKIQLHNFMAPGKPKAIYSKN